MKNRLLCVGLASAALVLTACGNSNKTSVASSSQSLRLQLNYVGTVEHYAPYYALTEGLYKAAGLDVKITPGGDTPGETLLAAGQADIAVLDAQNTILAKSKGADVVAIATEYQDSPVSMTCRKDSGVMKPSDLVGKKLGLKQAAADYLPIIAASAGVKPSQIKVVPIGNQDLSLLISGKIDCMFTSFAFNEPRSVEDAGVPVSVFTSAALGVPSQANVYVTTRKLYDDPAMHKALVAWLSATGKAFGKLLDDPAAGADYMVKHAFAEGLNPAQQAYQSKTQVSYIANARTAKAGLLSLDPASWKKTAEVTKSMGLTDTVVDVGPLLADLTGEAGVAKR